METPPPSHNHPRVDHRFVLISLIFPHNEAANEKMMHAPTPPELRLPPSPVLSAKPLPSITPYVKPFEVDPENLRPGVTQDLSVVKDLWRLRADDSAKALDPSLPPVHGHLPSGGGASGGFDVLHALKVTTPAIRSVRNYLLSLPDGQGISGSQPRQTFRPASLSTSEPQKCRVSSDAARTDPLARIRSAVLVMLTVLRELEDSTRVPLSDDAYDVGSDRSSPSRVLSPTELSDVPTDASLFGLGHARGRAARVDPGLGRGGRRFQCGRGGRARATGAMGRTARGWQRVAVQAGSQDRAAREATGRRRAVPRHRRRSAILWARGQR